MTMTTGPKSPAPMHRETAIRAWPDDEAAIPREIAGLVTEYERHAAELREHRAWIRDADRHKRAAEDQDVKATEGAYREGKKLPGPTHMDRFNMEVSERQRKRRALENVLGGLIQEIKTIAELHRSEWLAERAEAVEAERVALEGLVAATTAQRESWYREQSMHRWLRELPDRSFRLMVPPSPGLVDAADECTPAQP